MDRDAVSALAREAARLDERRVLVLAGESGHFEAATEVIETAERAVEDGVRMAETTLVGPTGGLPCEHLDPSQTGDLLGTTRSAIVLDCRTALRPTNLGRVVGTIDGGGLLILLTPPLSEWANQRDQFDETLAIPPDTIEHVTGHFRDRLVETLQAHPGIGIWDLDGETLALDGLTGRLPARRSKEVAFATSESPVPAALFEACLTQDQVDAVADLASLREAPRAAVLEADRGRGKSSVAGLIAAWFAAEGEEVLVTGPGRQAADAFFDRVREVLPKLDGIQTEAKNSVTRIGATAGGVVEFVAAPDIAEHLDRADVLFVEEAAALPVGLLETTLQVDRIAFTTTVHGYEGSGRGFAVRFRDSLLESRHEVLDLTLSEPIRYAAGDPVEVWATRALLLGAGPVPEQMIDAATPESVTYRTLQSETLRENEQLLREVFGLLVSAHYRTEPDDLARLLDGSNLAVRALLYEGHVAAVALVGREGGLPPATRADVALGRRIRANMLPDVLMSQLRDEPAGGPVGIRIVRIATHHAVRSRGLGTRLLHGIEREFGPIVDWIGTGFVATPRLVSFWKEGDYAPVHLATSRNDRSGGHSVLMMKPTSDWGLSLAARHARWFASRIRGVLPVALADLEPNVLSATLGAVPAPPPLTLTTHQWRVIADAAYGPGLYSVDPEPFRRLVCHALIDEIELPDRHEWLLIRGVLQRHSWESIAATLDFASRTAALREFGRALQPLVEAYGPPVTQAVRERFENQ